MISVILRVSKMDSWKIWFSTSLCISFSSLRSKNRSFLPYIVLSLRNDKFYCLSIYALCSSHTFCRHSRLYSANGNLAAIYFFFIVIASRQLTAWICIFHWCCTFVAVQDSLNLLPEDNISCQIHQGSPFHLDGLLSQRKMKYSHFIFRQDYSISCQKKIYLIS